MSNDKNNLSDKDILEVIKRNQDDIRNILYNDEIERLKQENAFLKSKLKFLKDICLKLENDEPIINDEPESIRYDNIDLQSQPDRYQSETYYESQMRQLREEKEKLQSENNHLKFQLDQYQSEVKNYQSQIGQLREEKEKLQSDNNRLELQLDKYQLKIDQLTDQIEQLKSVKFERLFNKLTSETREGLKNALSGKGERLFWKALKNIKPIWEYTKFLIIEEKRLEDVDILRDMMNILIAVDDEYSWDEVKIGDRFSEIDHIKAPSSMSNSGYITEILLKGLKKGNKQITKSIVKVER